MEKPYPYQLRAYEAIKAGRSIIIQAPTGAGKTRAALYPYFANLEQTERLTDAQQSNLSLPLTCHYAVPMRVLATQFQREYREHFARLDQLRGTRFTDIYNELGINVPAIQTGETPDDTLFESPLTFCTIDQLLASFIGTPYSVSPRQANLNVGAIVGSYLILDEFHLYPVSRGNGARLTSLAMLRMLRQFSPFVVMTATLSSRFLDALARLLDADVIQVDPQETQHIQAGRTRFLHRSQEPMTAEAILAGHASARARGMGATLVVCNTVARAQSIYLHLRQALNDALNAPAPQLMLLHSRFTPEDRREKSNLLEQWLGKDTWNTGNNPNVIVVATQVVEVGLNISAAVLHTEIAPANALIQRFGRCARFTQQQGDIFVYPIPANDNGNISHRPYDDALSQATWNYLEHILPTTSASMSFNFSDEQRMIDEVHSAEDQRMLDRFSEIETSLRRTILETLTTHQSDKRSQLIRDVDSVSVLIHPDPEHAITTRPFSWTAFSLAPGSLRSAWNHLKNRQTETDAPWIMKQLIPAGEQDIGTEEDSRREPIYTWEIIRDLSEIKGALRIALPPQLATYDRDLGFRLLTNPGETSTDWVSSPIDATKGKPSFPKREQRSYVEHISGLMRAYDWSVRREMSWIAARLQSALSLPDGMLDMATRFAIAFHDLGKLCIGWQQWAHAYQQQLEAQHGAQFTVPPARRFLAKTDMLANWQLEKAIRAKLPQKKPPSHACAGAVASPPLLYNYLFAAYGTDPLTVAQNAGGQAIMRSTLSAIARHHSPNATTHDNLAWESDVLTAVSGAIASCRITADTALLDLSPRPRGEVAEELLTLPERDGEAATWLSFALVRALRLCDQRAERQL